MWEQIRANKRKSVVLVVVVAALLFALGGAIGEYVQPGGGVFGVGAAGVVWFVLTLVSYFQGDSILLGLSGARRIEKRDHPRLFNVVEEMSIAAGLPKVPDVYIIEDTALNAFATGRKPERASVAVTSGLLQRLNRDQLQGVIAHEISHVVNRDVLFMTLVGVMVGAIVMISDAFLRGMFRSGRYTHSRSSRRGGGGGGNAIMLILALVLAILAPVLAQLIYFAASRRREYLADANAAVLTRYPEGLASALEAISGDPTPAASANRATAPMYIVNPLRAHGGEGSSAFSTHPPTSERVRILRSMAGAASFPEYQRAWQQVGGAHAGQLPASALAAGAGVAIRAPQAETQDVATRRHQAGDAIRRAERYAFLSCPCGLRLKLPPDFPGGEVECPRCHRRLPAVTG
jgi:heat shock protein HtpX